METVDQLNQLVKQIQGRLNDALLSLTRKPVNIKLKTSGLMPITEAHKLLDNVPGQVTAVYIPIIGDIIGDIFVFLPGEMANNIADLLIGKLPGTTRVIGEFESSALKEFGNITFGVIVTELANSLKMPMMLTVPNLATDMASALMDQVLIEYWENSPDMLAIQMPFVIENVILEGNFIILFDKKSSDLISSKLGVEIQIEKTEGPADGTN